MKEAHVAADSSVTIHDAPIPTLPSSKHMLVKVLVAGVNPKDWKQPSGILKTLAPLPNPGDDLAGIVVEVGEHVTRFRVGDRVAALHELGASGGSFAEYAVAAEHTAWHVGKDRLFEEAASAPMAALMAAVGLFGMLRVAPGPWAPLSQETPLLVYGAAGAVGAMVVRLAKRAGVRPVVAVAGHGIAFVEGMIDKEEGDAVVDYRPGAEAVVLGVKTALGGRKLLYAFDAVSQGDSFANTAKVLHPDGGKVSFVLPQKRDEFGPGVQQTNTMAGVLWKRLTSLSGEDVGDLGEGIDGETFGLAFSAVIGKLLDTGELPTHPYEVLRGLSSIETALKNLRSGKNSAKKYVVRIRDSIDGEVLL